MARPLGEPDQAIERTITVLVIACPHALGLAIPLVIAISTSVSAKAGILVRDRLALERMRTVDTVLLDKTGTLTTGEPAVRDVLAVDGDRDAVLALAAAAEAESEHPLARAIVAEAQRQGLPVPAATGFRAMAGRGVRAEVDGAEVVVGRPRAAPGARRGVAAGPDRRARVLAAARGRHDRGRARREAGRRDRPRGRRPSRSPSRPSAGCERRGWTS